jgi:hypothetical protein
MVGSKVDLLNGPIFEGRNGIVAEDVFEPILPFVLSIGSDQVTVQRSIGGHYEHPYRELWGRPFRFTAVDWMRTIGTDSPAAYLLERREKLVAERASATDPLTQMQLDQRISFLGSPRWSGLFGWGMSWDYALSGEAVWHDPLALFEAVGDRDVPWLARFQIGIWDADALCAFMQGSLLVPLRPKPE